MPYSRYVFGTLPWYSVLIVTGVCLALYIASREEKRLGLPKDTVVDLALWVIPAGIVGARTYYVAFAWETFRHNPVSVLYIWQGGLAIYGAVIGGLLAAVAFSRVRKLSLSKLTDIIAPGLLLAQAIGRWGNFFNMEAYGLPVTDPAWQFFPVAVRIPAADGDAWHMATFFYESLWDALGFLALMFTRKRMLRSGDTTLWYFLIYGSGRLIVEGLRTDSLMATETLRISQLLSVALCMAVVIIFLVRTLKGAAAFSLIAGLLTSLLLAGAAAYMDHPAAFVGYEPACLLAIGIVQFAGGTLFAQTRRAAALVCSIAACGTLIIRIMLADASLPAWGVSTIAAGALSLLLLLGGASVYAFANTAAARRSSTVS